MVFGFLKKVARFIRKGAHAVKNAVQDLAALANSFIKNVVRAALDVLTGMPLCGLLLMFPAINAAVQTVDQVVTVVETILDLVEKGEANVNVIKQLKLEKFGKLIPKKVREKLTVTAGLDFKIALGSKNSKAGSKTPSTKCSPNILFFSLLSPLGGALAYGACELIAG